MTDLFEQKAKDWDARPTVAVISAGVGGALLEHVPLSPELEVMDFGAGTGLVSGHLAPHVGRIYAVDISQAMLEKLAAKPELESKVEIVCQDILDQPLHRSVGLIVSAMALHHVEDTARLLQTFADHLAPGGRVALADLDAEDGTFHPPDVEGVYHHGFDRAELRAKLEQSGLQEVEFRTAAEIDKEGKRYTIFLVTAKKR